MKLSVPFTCGLNTVSECLAGLSDILTSCTTCLKGYSALTIDKFAIEKSNIIPWKGLVILSLQTMDVAATA